MKILSAEKPGEGAGSAGRGFSSRTSISFWSFAVKTEPFDGDCTKLGNHASRRSMRG
jgi:hypothetical protein